MRVPTGAVLAQDKQNEVSQKAAEELQAQVVADEESSYYVSTLNKRCEELQVQLMEMTNKNTRLSEENSCLPGQMCWMEEIQAENANVKGQLTRVAEEQNSAIQDMSCLQTQLEDAECKLEVMRETVERRQQLEKEYKETKLVLQRKEKEDEFLQYAQAEVNRKHKEAMQLF